MYHITLSKEIKQNCPEFRGAAVFAQKISSALRSF